MDPFYSAGKKFLICMSVIVVTLFLCKGPGATFAEDHESAIFLYLQQTFTVKSYMISQDIVEGGAPVWTSANTEIATVNGDGLITAVGMGLTYIYAEIPTKTNVKVVKFIVDVHSGVASVKLSESEIHLVSGQKFELTADVVSFEGPKSAFETRVRWSVNNVNVATVDSNGVVTAVGPGDTQVFATSVDGKKISYCDVQVVSLMKSIKIEQDNLTLSVGEQKQITTRMDPLDAPVKTVIFTTSQPDVVGVSESGVLTAKSLGQSTIIATTLDGQMSSNITVFVKTKDQPVDVSTLKEKEKRILIRLFDRTYKSEKKKMFQKMTSNYFLYIKNQDAEKAY